MSINFFQLLTFNKNVHLAPLADLCKVHKAGDLPCTARYDPPSPAIFLVYLNSQIYPSPAVFQFDFDYQMYPSPAVFISSDRSSLRHDVNKI